MNTIILGIIQGLTEFLPVSSSGHLVIFQHLIEDKSDGTLLEVLLHLGTFAATLVVFRKKLSELFKGFIKREREPSREVGLILLACVPSGIIGVFGQKQLSALFESPRAVSIAMLVTAALLWSTRYISDKREKTPLNWKKALAIGTIQGLAIIPGISRSGSTICSSLHLGVDRKKAGEFSFLISLPAIAGAVLLDTVKLLKGGDVAMLTDWSVWAAVAVAFVVGYAALVWLLKFVQQGRMHLFAPYVLLVGVLGLLWF